MENAIIILVLIIVAVLALRSVLKRFARKTSCCSSGSDYTPQKKRLKNVVNTRVFQVEGMHCEKCAGRVMEVINDIPGVAGTVDLKKALLTVSYEEDVSDELLSARLERAGYKLGQEVK